MNTKRYNLKIVDQNFGYEIGKKFTSLFKLIYPLILTIDKDRLHHSEKYISTLKETYPEKLQRLKGLSSYTGIDIIKLNALSIFLARVIRIGCTDSFSGPSVTVDGKVYLTWNMDIFGASKIFIYLLKLIVVDIPGYKRYVGFGLPIMGGIGILNEEGLAYVATAVGMEDGGGDGLLDMDINNLCMEKCGDVESVLKTYKENKISSVSGLTASIFLNLNCIWGDTKGNGVAIEHSSNYIHFEPVKEGILAIANHHQFLDRKLTGSVDPSQMNAITGSYCRLGRMWKLLKENKGIINLDILKKISSDHIVEKESIKDFSYKEPVDDATICCHYWNISKYIKKGKIRRAYETYLMGKTLLSYIIEPKDLIIHRCKGNPCRNPYYKCDFKEALTKGSLIDTKFITKIYSKTHKNFYKIPGMKIYMDSIYKKFLRKVLLLLVLIFEKLIKIEVKRN